MRFFRGEERGGSACTLPSGNFRAPQKGDAAGQGTIDFADIDPTKVQQPSFSGGDASGGTLDGTHTANIALLGNYLASTFVPSSDGHGGTSVVDPPAAANQNNPLALSQHA